MYISESQNQIYITFTCFVDHGLEQMLKSGIALLTSFCIFNNLSYTQI